MFLLSICTFIAVLIISRFKDIARFTALTGDFSKTGLFIAYHIPTILPIAIPLSALIASTILFQSLSRSFELTALRASGLSIPRIIAPVLAISILLSFMNFLICAEIGPYCRREGKGLIYNETSQNPLLLLQRQKLVKLKHTYIDMEVKNDETTKNLTMIIPNEGTGRLSLISARRLFIKDEELKGIDLAIVSHLKSERGFDSLIIENQSTMSTAAPLLSQALKKNRPRLDISALSSKMLKIWKKPKAALIESLRRISLSLAVFSFTLLGCTFGIDHRRKPIRKNLIFALLLTLSVLVSYLLGKELKHFPLLAISAFLLPHPFIWVCSSIHLYRISKGRA